MLDVKEKSLLLCLLCAVGLHGLVTSVRFMHLGFELHWVLGLGKLFRYDYTPEKNCGVLGKSHA